MTSKLLNLRSSRCECFLAGLRRWCWVKRLRSMLAGQQRATRLLCFARSASPSRPASALPSAHRARMHGVGRVRNASASRASSFSTPGIQNSTRPTRRSPRADSSATSRDSVRLPLGTYPTTGNVRTAECLHFSHVVEGGYVRRIRAFGYYAFAADFTDLAKQLSTVPVQWSLKTRRLGARSSYASLDLRSIQGTAAQVFTIQP
jgi:hypothetical protein